MGAALQKSLAERKKHEAPMRPRWERKAFLREARDAIVVSPLPDAYQDFIGSWMDKPKKILNDEGIEEDELTPGALFDVKDKPWFIEKSKQTGLGAGRTPCKEKKFRSGHTFVIPAGYTADEDFRGCMKSIKIGLKDDRTERLHVGGHFKVAITADGRLSPETMAKFKSTLSSGRGEMSFEYFVPCLKIETTLQPAPMKFAWAQGVILGAFVKGSIQVEGLGDDELDVDAGFGCDLDVEDGAMSADVKANYNKITSGQILCGQMEQDGGPDLRLDWDGQPLVNFFKHLEKNWRPQVMKNPLQWTVQRVIVREPEDDADLFLANRVHCVSVGQMGVGKSKFLTAFAKGTQNEFGEDLFISGVDPHGGMASVTKEITSELVQIDYQNYATPTLLTDVPGFGDPTMHGDERTCEQLLAHLHKPGNTSVHAIVLVEKFGTTRFTEAHLNFLKHMEKSLGDKMWNHLVIVLTHFNLIDTNGTNIMGDDKVANRKHAERLLEERKLAWRNELRNWFPAAQRVLAANMNMLFAVDSEALLAQEDPVGAESASIAAGNAKASAFLKEFSEEQMRLLRMFLQARLRANACLKIDKVPPKKD